MAMGQEAYPIRKTGWVADRKLNCRFPDRCREPGRSCFRWVRCPESASFGPCTWTEGCFLRADIDLKSSEEL